MQCALSRKAYMDAMRFVSFLGIVLAGGVLMAFILELLSTERYDPRAAHQPDVKPAASWGASLPAFFATGRTSGHSPASPVLDDALVAFLEEHVRAEHAMVTTFVHFPSLDSLYRQARPSPTMH